MVVFVSKTTMFGIDSHGDMVSLYTVVATGIFVLAVRFGTLPLPQLVAVSMVAAVLCIDRDDDIAHQLDILSITTLACVSTAFALLYHDRSNGVDTTSSKTASLAVMFFVVAYYGLGVDGMIRNAISRNRHGGTGLCDKFSVFALGTDSSWQRLERAIEEDDLVKQKKAMGELTTSYHPLRCPLACKTQCNHTFQQIESIRHVLIDKK